MALRLVRPRDEAGIRQLLEPRGGPADDLTVQRLVAADPRRRLVICATALIDGAERVVGIAAVDLATDAVGDPLVEVDTELTDGLDRALADALRAQAQIQRIPAA